MLRKNTIEFIMGYNNLVVKKANGCCCCLTKRYKFGKGKLDRINIFYSSYLSNCCSKRYYRYRLRILTFNKEIEIFKVDISYPALTKEEIDNFCNTINNHIKNNMNRK